ncbi:MAG: hypothetical protein QXI33_02265 [Candidatus Pacearchaeota archaeon]
MKNSIILKAALVLLIFILLFSISHAECENCSIEKPVYIVPYVGDIDGSVSDEWYYFYDLISRFYDENEIPAGFSFYPASLNNNPNFIGPFIRMYNSKNIELIQKGYKGDERELKMDSLSYRQQRSIIRKGQRVFLRKMSENGFKNAKLPKTYNQIGARVTNETIRALENLGFKIYLDVYYDPDVGPVKNTKTFDNSQYGVSFTVNGEAGAETYFKSQEEIFRDINEINNEGREDVEILKINNISVIPLWVHQQDFEGKINANEIDEEKWNLYKDTILKLKNNTNVTFLKPIQVYEMRHSNFTNTANLINQNLILVLINKDILKKLTYENMWLK